ncbi:MAG: ABC transporter permease subunit [Candidatus Thiodiazotropha taylori]
MGAWSALYAGRLADRMIVLLAESLRAFPTLLLVLVFATAGLPATLFLAAYFWIPVWRLTRPALAAQKRQPYALNARLIGMGQLRTLVTEVGPNALSGSIPYLASLTAEILAAQAALEFLGFGPPIEQPSLGGMLLSATQLGFVAPWVWLPSLAIIMTIVNLTAVLAWRTQRSNLSVPLG